MKSFIRTRHFILRQDLKTHFLVGLQGGRVGSRWPLCGAGPAWGASQASCPQSQPSPSPWTSQFSLQTPNICLPHFCRDGNRILKLANRFWIRQESKMTHRGKQPPARPGPAWPGHQVPTQAFLPGLPFRWLF